MNKRVVITGLGVVSSIGVGKENFLDALIKGKSGITEISAFDTAKFPTHYGGEVKGFNPEAFIKKIRLSKIGRASCLAISSARLAFSDAQLKFDAYNRKKIGVCVGTTMGESQVLEKLNEAWVNRGESAIDPILRKYGDNTSSIFERVKAFNAEKIAASNAAISIRAFPKIKIAVILWARDNEFSAECNMLFNPEIKEILPTEDVAVLGGIIASLL